MYLENLTKAHQLVAFSWHDNGRPYPLLPSNAAKGQKRKQRNKTPQEIHDEIRSIKLSDEEYMVGGPFINWDRLADAVVELDPTLTGAGAETFRSIFKELWAHVESTVQLDSFSRTKYQIHVEYDERHEFFFNRLNRIATRKKPVGSRIRRKIRSGDQVSYPDVWSHMHTRSPNSYGDYNEYVGGRDFYGEPDVTHRQLSLHAEFSPLLAAIFLCSRMPRALINGRPVKSVVGRPLMSQLMETLLLRRPDNAEDVFIDACVRWLLVPRIALFEERNDMMIG